MTQSLVTLAILLSSLTGTLLLLQKQQRNPVVQDVRHFSEAHLADMPLLLEYAETPWQKIRGLSGRDALPEGHGMFFVYGKPGDYGIWMKDMRFSIDILWFDEHKRLVSVHEAAPPGSYPQVFTPPHPAQFILEMNAGFIASSGVGLGDELIVDDPRS